MRKKLKLFRIERELTQAEMAKELGYSREHYRRVEAGTQNYTRQFEEALQKRFGITHEKATDILKMKGE